jgi:hypothetical protein
MALLTGLDQAKIREADTLSFASVNEMHKAKGFALTAALL